ncbi:MAG: hypothetical protein MJB57_18595 [Gemmatimonadetes bacterium]|nr:hypothetical protein [Gemmatimonadota bacterium]
MFEDRARSTRGRRRLGGLATGLAAVVAALGCRSDGLVTPGPPPPPEPGPVETAALSILRQATTAPPLSVTDTSFVVTRGEDFELELRYEPRPGESEGEEFLEFELDDESLLRYPPGHPRAGQLFANGDTITIRIQVDPARMIATLEPSGLEFDPDEPAELEIRYGNADGDYDDDGEEDPPEAEAEIDLWRQENIGDPWFRVGEIKDEDLDRVRARLTSFSRYALAI